MLTKYSRPLLLLVGVLWIVLAATIIFFELNRPPTIQVSWQTETELNTAGFHIYRGEDEACLELSCDFIQINNAIIPSEGSAISGASYSFSDETAKPNQTYYYQLEEIELSGLRNRYDIIVGEAPRFSMIPLILAIISFLVGTILIGTNIRKKINVSD